MIERTFKEIIKNFNRQEQDLIIRRYGLNGEKETLESIGKTYNITRERVRQIQKKISPKLEALIDNHPKIREIIENIKKNYLGELGFRREKDLFLDLKTKEGLNDYHFKIFWFFSNFSKKIVYQPANNIFHGFFCQNEETYFNFYQWLKEIYLKFIKENNYLSEEETIKLITEKIKKKLTQKITISKQIIEILSTVKHLAKNPFNFWGPRNHHYISPKNLKEKIILILKHEKKPLHFTHIYKILMEIKSINHELLSHHWNKDYNLYSVKNELIRNQDFVLVGRGIYALREWNMQEGKAKEILIKIIKEKGKITKKELWQMISNYRQIKKQTFYIYLNEFKQKGLKEEKGYLIYND
jgi:hypothetical protein